MEIQQLEGISPKVLLEKILAAIDNGATTNEIRQNPFKYFVSGKTKEIVINTGGEGLKVSYEIIEEMAKRGDQLAKKLLEENDFKRIVKFSDKPNNKWTYLESGWKNYDRENPLLIQIIKEDQLHNIGGWTLAVVTVYVEPWSYRIRKSDDLWGSEYVLGEVRESSEHS